MISVNSRPGVKSGYLGMDSTQSSYSFILQVSSLVLFTFVNSL